jgi:hypothetical protein
LTLKSKKWLMYLFICLLAFSLGGRTFADDGDHNKHDDDNHEQEYYYESDQDDEDKEKIDWTPVQTSDVQTDYWFIWSREARNKQENPLPLAAAGELTVTAGDSETKLYFIPQGGQLLVSAEAFAKVIGAKSIYFPLSKICILTYGDHELIVRAGFNAAFENKVKTPMPTEAKVYENTVYLPVSVAANALGYQILWDAAKQKIILQGI